MATGQTINSLVTKVRQRADQINSTTFDDATELKLWVRASLVQLYEIFTQRSADWYTVSVPLSLSAGQEAYSVPSDFKALSTVFALFNRGAYRAPLREFEHSEFGRYANPMYAQRPMAYRLIRNLIYIQPVPTIDAFNALELVYTPQHRGPLLDYTPIDEVMPPGYDEWVVLDVLQKMSVKTRLQNMDDILKSKGEVQARLLAGIKSRTNVAPRMRDAMAPIYGPGGSALPSGPIYWASA